MTEDPGVRSGGPGDSCRLQQWIFGSVPSIGYSVLAQTPDLNLSFYAKRLDGIYTPLTGENLHGDENVVDVLMVHPASSGNELLFSLIGPGPPDEEFHRRTFVNHTAVLPVDLLRSGRLTFAEVERSLRSYDLAVATPRGDIDPLRVTLGPPGDLRRGTGISRYLSQASAETLLTRLLQEPESSTLVLCRNSTAAVRRLTLLRILESIPLACGLPFISSMSDAPALPVVGRFQLVIAARAFRTDSSWALLDNALEDATLPRLDGQESAYQALQRCYQPAPDAA